MGVADGLGSIGGVGLAEDVGHVVEDRAEADNQRIGYRLVALAGRNEAQHLDLARSQAIRYRRTDGGGRRAESHPS